MRVINKSIVQLFQKKLVVLDRITDSNDDAVTTLSAIVKNKNVCGFIIYFRSSSDIETIEFYESSETKKAYENYYNLNMEKMMGGKNDN